MQNKLRRMLLFALCVLFFGACRAETKTADPSAGRYASYYLDKTATKLTPLIYETQTTDKNRLVAELMQQLLHVPSEEDLITPTGDRTRYESFSFDDQVLYLYFDDGYRE